MKLPSTKSYYMSRLKEVGITQIEGRSIKSFKTHVIANLFFKTFPNQ